MSTAENLTTRHLNRALLARQHLLERADATLTQTVESVGGLQTQYAPSGYVGLWSRMKDFERDDMTRALESRRVIHGTLMRVTIHTVSAGDYWPMAAGVRTARREWFMRVAAQQLAASDPARLADAVRQILADGAHRWTALTRQLAERGFPGVTSGAVNCWVDVVRVPPSGTWDRRSNDLYGLAEQWIPNTEQPTEEEGIRLLLQRYLGGFGPARPADFADWAGLPASRALATIEKAELRRFRDERGRELIDLPDAPLPAAETRAPVRFLPPFDPTLLVNCRRTQILPEEYRARIFNTRTPWSIGTFLVNGQVAGTWHFDAKAGRMVTDAFSPLDAASRRELEHEAAALGEFHRP